MSHDMAYLLDILESSRLAVSYLAQCTKEQFFADVQRQDSVVRRLTIIGEAAGRVSDQTRCQLPDLPWGSMIGMRNLMVHRYDDVDMGIVWDTVRNDLPPLMAGLDEFIPSENQGDCPA